VATLNRQLYANTSLEKYATFYFALYHEATHRSPIPTPATFRPCCCARRTADARIHRTVVGAFPLARYEERTVELEHGDLLVAYTDGIVEPENAYGECFGEDRLKDLISNTRTRIPPS